MDYTDPANAPAPKLTPEQVEKLKADYQLEVLAKFQSFLNDTLGKPNNFTITVSGYRLPKADRPDAN